MKKIAVLLTALAVVVGVGGARGQVEVEWARTFNETGGLINGMTQCADGGYALCGRTIPDANRYGWLVKTDANGDQEFSQEYAEDQRPVVELFEVVELPDGGYAMAGWARPGAWVIRTNAAGDLIWSRTFFGNQNGVARSIVLADDGNIVAAGYIDSQFALFCLNLDGDLIWEQVYGAEQGYIIYDCWSLVQTHDGGFALAGAAYTGANVDFSLLKTDTQGEITWRRNYGRGGRTEDFCYAVTEKLRGGFLLAGSRDDHDGATGTDYWLVCVDENGDSLWSESYGSEGYEIASCIKEVDDGLIMAGSSNAFNQNGRNEAWLIRTDSRGTPFLTQHFGIEGSPLYSTSGTILSTAEGGFIFGAGLDGQITGGWLIKTTPDPTISPINVPEDCETIQQAINWATDGDTILVAAGTYTENLSIDGKSITIIGDPENPDNVVIDGNGGGAVVSFVGAGTDGAKLDGFSIRNASGVQWGEGALWGEEAGSITLSHLLVTNIAEYVFHSSNTVFNVDHTTIHTASQNGVFNATSVNLTNSIVRGFTGQLIRGGNLSANYSDIQGGYEGEGNIDADPRFLDRDNDDYHLTSTSPCMDTGDPNSENDPDGTRADMGAYYFAHDADQVLHVPDEYATIQTAINSTINGDAILVAPGTYTENLSIDGKSITIIGDPESPENVVIDGGGNGSVMFIKYVTEGAVTLDGLTLRDGVGTGWHIHHGDGHWYSLGGGLLVDQARVAANNLYIRNCTALEGGGIVGIDVTNIALNNVHFDSTSSTGGSVIYAYGQTNIVWNGGSITNDRGIDAEPYHSYAMFMFGDDTRLEMSNVLATRNSGAYDAAIYLYGNASVVLDRMTWVNNDWPTFAVLTGGSSLTARNSIFRGNNGNTYAGDISYCNAEGIEGGVGNIDADPLFTNADNGDFSLTNLSPCIDAGDPHGARDPDGSWADMGASYFPQPVQRIALRRGWNLLSSVNQPRNAAAVSVWSEVVERNRLIMTKDQAGRFYIPANGFCNIPSWDVRQGYWGKLAEPDTLLIFNLPEEATRPIPLHRGWNLISYFPEPELTAPTAFANLGENVLMVKDDMGRFYRPERNFSNMRRLSRGKGYQVVVRDGAELVYNIEGGEGDAAPLPDEEFPSHFVVSSTDRNMSVLLNAECKMQNKECEIGAFTESGLCVGSTLTLTSASTFGLAVWGDDPTTTEIDGAVEGEALGFRLWDGQAETPILLKWTEGEGVYQTDGFAMGEIGSERAGTPVLPTIAALYEAFPNPFNSTTSVRFDLPLAGKVTLAVRDITGREVARLAEGEFAAGSHSIAWKADGVATGVYLVRLEAFGKTFMTRAVIVR